MSVLHLLYEIFYHQSFFRPLVNLLVFFYQAIPPHDLGIAIVLLTILIRLILYPLTAKSLRAQQELTAIQPEVKEIQKQFKDNKEEQARRLMELYRERGINPLSGFLPILIQLPLLIALYRVFIGAAQGGLLLSLYWFTPRPEMVSPITFAHIDLSHPSVIFAVLAALSQFLQAYYMPQPAGPSSDFQRAMNLQMRFVFPFLIGFIAFKLPAALALYWLVSNLASIAQQLLSARTVR